MLGKRNILVVATLTTIVGVSLFAQMEKPPFGTKQDVAYAEAVWKAIEKKNLVGAGAVNTVPYPGQSPHGAVIETLYDTITVKGHAGQAIVKRNYGGENLRPSEVVFARDEYLQSITIMFKREPGYDGENKDWFYAKYQPDGSLEKHPKGMELAGRVAKGMNQGCIACHRSAAGGDFMFLNDPGRIDK